MSKLEFVAGTLTITAFVLYRIVRIFSRAAFRMQQVIDSQDGALEAFSRLCEKQQRLCEKQQRFIYELRNQPVHTVYTTVPPEWQAYLDIINGRTHV